MAGLWQRTSLIVKSKFSKLLNRAENPTETLDYSYEQMLQQLQNVKRGVADVVTAKKRLELQTQTIEQNVVKLETQARQAVAANREDLARQALERKAAAQQQLQGLDAQVQQLEDQQEKLDRGSQQQLETRIESFRSQKEVIKAQYSAAEAQVKIGEAATGIGRGMAGHRAGDPAREGQDRGAAGARLGDRRADRHRRARGLHRGRPDAARPRARADLGDAPGRRRAREAEGRGRIRRTQKEIAPATANRQPTRLRPPARSRRHSRPRKPPSPDRFGDILFGRKKLKEPARDRLFALTTAAVTLDVECGLKPAGVGAVVFKPLSAGEFTQVDKRRRGAARSGVATDSGSKLDRKTDTFGFEWVIVPRPRARGPGDRGVTRSRRSSWSAASAASCSQPRSASTAASTRSTGSTASRPARSGRSSRPARSRSATTRASSS